MLDDIVKAIQDATHNQPQINLAAPAAQKKLAEQILNTLKGKYYFIHFGDSKSAKAKEDKID
jgi:diphthamide synthase subunit DPH2